MILHHLLFYPEVIFKKNVVTKIVSLDYNKSLY
jgi:hypothetical protein